MGDLKFDEADKNSDARLFGNIPYTFTISRHGGAISASERGFEPFFTKSMPIKRLHV